MQLLASKPKTREKKTTKVQTKIGGPCHKRVAMDPYNKTSQTDNTRAQVIEAARASGETGVSGGRAVGIGRQAEPGLNRRETRIQPPLLRWKESNERKRRVARKRKKREGERGREEEGSKAAASSTSYGKYTKLRTGFGWNNRTKRKIINWSGVRLPYSPPTTPPPRASSFFFPHLLKSPSFPELNKAPIPNHQTTHRHVSRNPPRPTTQSGASDRPRKIQQANSNKEASYGQKQTQKDNGGTPPSPTPFPRQGNPRQKKGVCAGGRAQGRGAVGEAVTGNRFKHNNNKKKRRRAAIRRGPARFGPQPWPSPPPVAGSRASDAKCGAAR